MPTENTGVDPHRSLYAFYDLAAAPNTFDALAFLVLAELERRETLCASLHLFVVPGPNRGFRSDANVANVARQQYVRRNVIMSGGALVPACSGVTLCSTREFADRLIYSETLAATGGTLVFPVGYSVRFPLRHYHLARLVERWQEGADIPSLEPTDYGLALVDRFLGRCGTRKVVTVTLRESSFQPERNSHVEEWGRFLATLDPREYAVVVLRDLEKLYEPLPPSFVNSMPYPEAVISLELRAALYRRAYLNLCVNNGPGHVLLLDKQARYLYFRVVTKGVSCTEPEHHRTYSWLNSGDQIQFATPFQHLVWDDDRAEVLAREFASMVELIESGVYAASAKVESYLQEKRERWRSRYPGGWIEHAGSMG